MILRGVIINGGSGINLMPKHTMLDLGLQITRPANFSVTMADQHSVVPVGLIEQLPVQIQGSSFIMDFVVLRLPRLPGSFPLLIGRPWLRHVRAIHDWGQDQFWIIPQGSKVT